MSKKQRRKKQRIITSQPPQKVTFTYATVCMLKNALLLVDEAFLRNTQPLPNVELAYEVLGSLKTKLHDMLQQEEWDKETPFDYNEIHILYAAIHMWLVKLTFDKKHTDIDLCMTLCKQFSLLVERIDGKQLPAPYNTDGL